MFYVVLLALVAIFLGLRLYSVLGKRTGHEQQPLPRAADERAKPATLPRTIDVAPEPRDAGGRDIDSGAEQGLRQIVGAESGFDVGQFLVGAQSAYKMTLEAYWRGDESALDQLVEPQVAEAFKQAIADRAASGETLDNRLVRVDKAAIADARVTGRDARITVRFDADIVAITRDAEGNVIAGSMTDAIETNDVWTFARTLKSADPNWKLSDTDEA